MPHLLSIVEDPTIGSTSELHGYPLAIQHFRERCRITLISSAYIRTSPLRRQGVPFIKLKLKLGPSIDSWGTALTTDCGPDVEPLTGTVNVLFSRMESVQAIKDVYIPLVVIIFSEEVIYDLIDQRPLQNQVKIRSVASPLSMEAYEVNVHEIR